MTKTSLRVFAILPVLGLTMQAHAFTAPTPTPASSSTAPQYIVPGQGGNAAEAGRSTNTMQLLTAGVSGAAAGMYASRCSPYSVWNCVFAGMAAIGAVQSLQSAKGAKNAGMQLSGFDPSLDVGAGGVGDGTAGTGTGTTGTGGLDSTIPQAVARDLAQVRNSLEKSGVKMSPDGKSMTTPDGRTFDMSKGAGNSEQDLMAMGFSQSEAAAALADSRAIGKKVDEKFKQMSQLAGAGGGGGGRAVAAAEGGGDPFAGFDPFARERAARNRKKAKVSGLTKKLGSDNIGVAGDDIFEMVTRRYKARDEQNAFLKD